MRTRILIYLAVFAATLFAGWWYYGSLTLKLPHLRYQLKSWAIARFGDQLDRQARSLAGWRSLNCGHVGLRGNANPAIDCALSAYRQGRPFRVRFDLQGLTSPSEGVVFTPGGDLFELFYDRRSADSLLTGYYINERLIARRCQRPVRLVVERETAGAWVACSPALQSRSEKGR